MFYCRLKAYIVFTFVESFWNKSGKPQPIRTKVGSHAQIKGRQSSQNFRCDRLSGGEIMGAQKCPRPRCRSFFVSKTRWPFGNFAMVDFRQIWPRTTCKSWLKRIFCTEIYKFPFRGNLPPKPQTWRRSNRYLTQSRLQVKGCTAERYCLLHVVVQGPGIPIVQSTFLYDVLLRSYGPGVTSQNDYDFSMW